MIDLICEKLILQWNIFGFGGRFESFLDLIMFFAISFVYCELVNLVT
jgi:hypothetical protein